MTHENRFTIPEGEGQIPGWEPLVQFILTHDNGTGGSGVTEGMSRKTQKGETQASLGSFLGTNSKRASGPMSLGVKRPNLLEKPTPCPGFALLPIPISAPFHPRLLTSIKGTWHRWDLSLWLALEGEFYFPKPK